MPNITRGDRMGGLLVYLAGPGRHNEHSDPHLVAGDSAIMAWHDDAVLDRDAALAVARQLDHPRRAFGVEVPGGAVWHCSLSLRASEGELPDEKWAAIARDFVEEMGFTGDVEPGSGRAACRWVAVRHGVSAGGNDHVHVAVSLVREDGTKASVWNDRPRAQRVVGELERKHGLEVLESRQAGRGDRGVKPAELAKTVRQGAPEPARATLARTVRGCAAAAGDEAEFVRRARRAGLLVRPRYAAGREDVVAGYSVAQRPAAGERPVWYGGGHLAKDLTLPRLRADWPDTPQHAGAAVAEWNAARRARRPVAPGRETREPDPALWERYADEVGALRERLRAVPADDRATWAHVARETSGAFAAWSLRVEPTPGPLAATADSLARSAQLRAYEMRPRTAGMPSAKGAALLLASVAHGGTGTVAQAVLLRQLANTAKALHDAHRAAGDARRAAEIARAVRAELATVGASLPAPTMPTPVGAGTSPGQRGSDEQAAEAARLARAGQVPLREPGSPVPTNLQERRARQRTSEAPSCGRGNEAER
jgi:hypothetical protein